MKRQARKKGSKKKVQLKKKRHSANKWLALIVLAIACITLVSILVYGNRRYYFDMDMEYAIRVARTRREAITRPDYQKLIPYTQGYEYILDDMIFMIYQFGGLENFEQFMSEITTTPAEPAYRISSDMAIFDASVLLMMMRLQYSAYIYFGGDDVFQPLFLQIRDVLASQAYWETSPTGNFMSLIHNTLFPVIADNHFSIGGLPLGWLVDDVPHRFYSPVSADFFVSANDFSRSSRGFSCNFTGRYIREVVGHDVSDIFRLAFNDYAAIVYVAVLYISEGYDAPIKILPIIYENGERGLLPFMRHIPARQRSLEYPTLEWIEGVPVVTITSMAHYPSEDARLFTNLAYKLRSEPVVVLDVRSNRGGNNLLPTHFFYMLTGEIIPSISRTLHVGSQYGFYRYWGGATSGFHSPFTGNRLSHPTRPFGSYHFIIDYGPRRIMPNDSLIIVLTDRYTSSAGERVVDLALSMENALIIGQNTAGVGRALGTPPFYMPYSGLPFTFGAGLIFRPPGLFAEGIGIAPDIWSTGCALEAALVFLRGEGLMN